MNQYSNIGENVQISAIARLRDVKRARIAMLKLAGVPRRNAGQRVIFVPLKKELTARIVIKRVPIVILNFDFIE